MGLNWMGKLNAKELNERKKNTTATKNNNKNDIICCAERESKCFDAYNIIHTKQF